MGIKYEKNMLRKLLVGIAKRILKYCQPYKYVSIDISQLYKGGILYGKNIVIIDGEKELGYEMAKKFVSEGANVIISGKNEEMLKYVCLNIGEKCHYIVCDICKTENYVSFIEGCVSIFNSEIDCMVCNAANCCCEKFDSNIAINGFNKQFETNLMGPYFLCQTFLSCKINKVDMVKTRLDNAQILFITSETDYNCYDISYRMTEAAMNSYIRALSRRVYKYEIRVNAIVSRVTTNDLPMESFLNDVRKISYSTASRRQLQSEEVAKVACFLLSDASKCISGEIIHTSTDNHLCTLGE